MEPGIFRLSRTRHGDDRPVETLCARHRQLVPVPGRFQPVSRPWQGRELAVFRQTFCDGGRFGAAHYRRDLFCLSGQFHLLRHIAQYRRRKPRGAAVPASPCSRDAAFCGDRFHPAAISAIRTVQRKMAGLDRFFHHAAPLERLCSTAALACTLPLRACGFAIRHATRLARSLSKPEFTS
ncbi:hypothetical protein D3C86_1441780 [compost metagenome]